MFRTFDRYVARQFLMWFGVAFVVLAGTICLFEFIEMVRRTSNWPESGLALNVELTLLKAPRTADLIFHFVVLFSAMFTFWRLTRSNELVVARATGISAWQFLLPVLAITLVIGLFKVAVFNPIATSFFDRYVTASLTYTNSDQQFLQISRNGIWLRQRTPGNAAVINAERSTPGGIQLHEVTIFLYDEADMFTGRINADTAILADDHWVIENARIQMANERAAEVVPQTTLPTNLTQRAIEDSFSDPRSQSFWELPAFIDLLDETGFSSHRHRLHYQSLLSQPLLLISMVVFAAAFTLRQIRRGGVLLLAGIGVSFGFVLFILNDISYAQGAAGTTPPMFAAWAPSILSLFAGTGMIMYLEDG